MKEYGLAVVSVSDYNNNNPLQSVIDRNGKQSVILTSVAGRIPNKNVLTGTVAESAKIVAGEMCLVQVLCKLLLFYGYKSRLQSILLDL